MTQNSLTNAYAKHATNTTQTSAVQDTKRTSTAPFSLRLTPQERALLAERAGQKSLGEYIRQTLFQTQTPTRRVRKPKPVQDHVALGQILGLMGQSHIAQNLEELKKAVQTGELIVPHEATASLHEARAEMQALRALLLQALGKAA